MTNRSSLFVRLQLWVFVLTWAGILLGSGLAQEIDPQQIDALLAAKDSASLDQAVASIRSLLVEQPQESARRLRGGWLDALSAAGRHETVAELAIPAIVEYAADVRAVEELQTKRVRALLKADKPRQALSAAKGLFNVASMAHTRQSLLTVAECLNATYPDDPSIVERFRREQIAGAATRPAAAKSVLDSIPIDPSPFEAGLRLYAPGNYVLQVDEFSDKLAYGNLLLLAGQSLKAEQVFRNLPRSAEPERQAQTNEAIARSLKAQDGGIFRANEWVRALRQ